MATTLRPTLGEIVQRIENDAKARLTEEELRRSDVKVLLRVLAGASHGMYNAIAYGIRQMFTDTAEGKYLERKGSLFGMQKRAATTASGTVTFVWTQATDVPLGTLLQSESGYQYATVSSPTAEGIAQVEAVNPGAEFNLVAESSLSLVNPIAGITSATVTDAIEGGEDEETEESYRERILAHTRTPPRQGTKEDYEMWAKEVPGVGYAWCYPRECEENSVTVRILDTEGNFPDEDLLERTQAYLESKNNALAIVHVVAPLEQKVNFTLKISPDSLALRSAAEAAIKDLFKREAIPGNTIYLSHMNAVLSAVSGEEDHVIVSPTANAVATDDSYLLTVGEFTWQT